LTKSAQQGHAQAQNDLALMYLHGQGVVENPQEAAKWLTLAAEQNLPEAQYHLSSLYAQGKGVSKDEDIAFDLLSKSAQANYVKAQYDLGLYYIRGRIFVFCPEGFNKSKDLFDFKYIFEVIKFMRTFNEKILPNMNKKDVETGFSWLEKAKELGYQKAAEALKQLSIWRFIDFKTGKLDVHAFQSAQPDKQMKALIEENIDEILK
jgi:TPR repeat protein